jgi:hypothetical protein
MNFFSWMKKLNSLFSLQQSVQFLGQFGLILTALATVLFFYYSTSFQEFQGYLYNSDALYLPSLYNDVIRGNELLMWNLPPSPYIFPDMLLYFCIRAIATDIHTAAIAFGIVQYLIFILGLIFLAKHTFHPAPDMLVLELIVLMGVAFIFALTQMEYHVQLIFASAFHFGIVLVAPFVLGIVQKLRVEPRPDTYFLWVLYGISFLTTVSDWLYLVQITFPLVCCLLILYRLTKKNSQGTFTVIRALILASVLGLGVSLINVWSHPVSLVYLSRTSTREEAFAQLINAVKSIPLFHVSLLILFFGTCIFSSVKTIIEARPHRNPLINFECSFLPLYFIIAFVVNVTAIIVSGKFVDSNGFRYLLPWLTFPAFWGFPFIISIPKSFSYRLFKWVVIGVLGLSIVFAVKFAGHSLPYVYYPPHIECMDKELSQYGSLYGVANYWQARPTSMLSRSNLQVVQVTRDLTPYYWINNSAWYGIEPKFAIIDLSLPENDPLHLDEKLITSRFGNPTATFLCGQSKVLVYNHINDKFKEIFYDLQK